MSRLFVAVVLLVGITACDKEPAAPAKPPAPTPSAAAPAQAPAAPSVMGDTVSGELRGTVLESVTAAGYTYLRLQTSAGDQWAAIPEATIENGREVAVVRSMEVNHFKSKALDRTFEKLTFGSGLAGAAAAPAAAPKGAAGAPAAGPMMGGPQEAAPITGIAKATGPEGRTVKETFAAKKELDGKTVAVSGQVVKYAAGILGKNWIHLQDGTGTAEGRDNDLVVTTQATAAKGDRVTVKGKLTLDQDIGSGYRYPVLLQDATLTR